MATPRSYLFAPGDSPRKIEKAAAGAAEAVIIDLEDSVASARKAEALATTCEFLATRADPPPADAPELWVRINGGERDAALAELAGLPLARATGVFLPKLADHAHLTQLAAWLDALEARDGLAAGAVGVVGIVTESARALAGERAATLARGHPRLRGYAWGTEDLSAALGRAPLAGSTSAGQRLSEAAQLHCLLLAAAAGVDAIDGVSTAIADADALTAECDAARELGFVAKMAIHPNQLAPINTGLAPSTEALAWAERVAALVRDNPDQAAFSLDGRMVDQPHIDVAHHILARAGRAGDNGA